MCRGSGALGDRGLRAVSGCADGASITLLDQAGGLEPVGRSDSERLPPSAAPLWGRGPDRRVSTK